VTDRDLKYGDLGYPLPEGVCRECWGERYVWLGNAWGMRHVGDGSFSGCGHECHEGEIWIRGTMTSDSRKNSIRWEQNHA
jgi:hypothetical protein